MKNGIKIKAKKANSKFVALDSQRRGKVIAEGRTVKSVVEKANKTGKKYSMMFVPSKGQTYIY